MITEHQNSHHGDHESIYHCMILETLLSIIICTGGTNTFIVISVDGRSLTQLWMFLFVVLAFYLFNEAIMCIQSEHGDIFQFSLENRRKNSLERVFLVLIY